MNVLWLLAFPLIAVALFIRAIARRLRENGGFWYYLQHENRPRRYRRCPECQGTSVVILMWDDESGTTKWAPPPPELRGWYRRESEGGRMEADGANSKTCPRCLGVGNVWVMPENPDRHLHIPDEPMLPWQN